MGPKKVRRLAVVRAAWQGGFSNPAPIRVSQPEARKPGPLVPIPPQSDHEEDRRKGCEQRNEETPSWQACRALRRRMTTPACLASRSTSRFSVPITAWRRRCSEQSGVTNQAGAAWPGRCWHPTVCLGDRWNLRVPAVSAFPAAARCQGWPLV